MAAGVMNQELSQKAGAACDRDPYRGQRVSLLTQHGKERVVAPILDSTLGCQVERVAGYDTDLLGTFARDIARGQSQLDTARTKARIGMELSGLCLGLASEGAFGLDPFAGMFPWNVEFLIFIDDWRGLEVVGIGQGRANSAQLLATHWMEVEAFARAAGFPEHYLIVRPEGENDGRIRKGIAGWAELKAAYVSAVSESSNGHVYIEVDLRAYANPTRLINIRLAAVDLARRLNSFCPGCHTPGFWIVESVQGLPCKACKAPTRQMQAEIYGCLKCGHRVVREQTDREYADPGHCDQCNP